MPLTLRIISVILAIMAARAYAVAALVRGTSEAETKALVETLPDDTEELTVDGPADCATLHAAAMRMTALRRIDLGSATIASRTIAPYTFAASTITEIILPSDIDVVGEGAFAACAALASAAPLENLDSIAPYAFAHCTALTTLAPAPRLRAIARAAFSGCRALTKLDRTPALQTVGPEAFLATGLSAADFSQSTALASIGDMAFAQCDALTTVTLPPGLTSLGRGAFMLCPALSTISGGEALTALPELMATASPALEATLPEGITAIGAYALSGVKSTSTLRLPASLKTVSDGAMERMTGLQTIDATALADVPATGLDVWDGVSQPDVRLIVSHDAYASFAAAPQWSLFRIEDASSSGIGNATAADGTLTFHFEGTTIIAESSGAEISAVEIFDTAGRPTATYRPGASLWRHDTAAWAAAPRIIVITLADGTRAARRIIPGNI